VMKRVRVHHFGHHSGRHGYRQTKRAEERGGDWEIRVLENDNCAKLIEIDIRILLFKDRKV
jgi:hypothetical protein